MLSSLTGTSSARYLLSVSTYGLAHVWEGGDDWLSFNRWSHLKAFCSADQERMAASRP